MVENTPSIPEEIRQLNRSLMEKVIEKAASDPEWKQRLLEDPEAAMAEANFPEARGLREMQEAIVGAQEEEAEVTGQQGRDVCFLPFTAACRYTSSNPIAV